MDPLSQTQRKKRQSLERQRKESRESGGNGGDCLPISSSSLFLSIVTECIPGSRGERKRDAEKNR